MAIKNLWFLTKSIPVMLQPVLTFQVEFLFVAQDYILPGSFVLLDILLQPFDPFFWGWSTVNLTLGLRLTIEFTGVLIIFVKCAARNFPILTLVYFEERFGDKLQLNERFVVSFAPSRFYTYSGRSGFFDTV